MGMGNDGFACWRRICHCAEHVEDVQLWSLQERKEDCSSSSFLVAPCLWHGLPFFSSFVRSDGSTTLHSHIDAVLSCILLTS